MTPEGLAREHIDAQLRQAGWVLQDPKKIDFTAGLGVAVREFQGQSGPADYVLFVEGKVAGIIEAKAEGTTLSGVVDQAARYQANLPHYLQSWCELLCDKDLDFEFEDLHPSKYMGKIFGGLVDAPPPKPKPTREELQVLVQEIPVVQIAKRYETSGVTIRKWCLQDGIEVPPRGYWTRRRSEERQAAKLESKGLSPRPPRPSKEVLVDLIWKMPANEVAKLFGSTGSTVLKWAVSMGIKCPGRGYWSKRGGEAYQKRKKALCLAARRKAVQSTPDVIALSA